MKAAASNESSKPAEDESLKKKTDCVYFLASPLTCKKGNECEYRHSEEARMNPRDCYFWLNGNCLAPKCAYRHPPLDGLVGTPVAASAKPSIPHPLPVASAQPPVLKQATPCYYFQKGQCLKGDRCAFMHASQPVDRVPPQLPAQKTAAPGIEPQNPKNSQWSLEHCNQQKNVMKPVGVQTSMRPPVVKNVAAAFTNETVVGRSMLPVSQNSGAFRYQAANVSSVSSGNFGSRSLYAPPQTHPSYDHNFQNNREPGEVWDKTSTGFNVPVNAQLIKSDYYKGDDFGRTRGDVGRNLNTAKVVDYGHSAEYPPATRQGYDTYGKVQERYVQEPRKGSSERISDGSYLSESRGYSRVKSPEQIGGSDLRQRLSKQRRTNGSRSDVSPDSRSDLHRRDDRVRRVEDQRYQSHHLRGDSHYLHQESSRRSRLQGRLSHPGRSSPDRIRDDFQDRERRRSSPPRSSISSFTGIPHDSIRRGVGDEFNAEERRFRTPLIKRDDADDSLNFAGPKRLVELKKGRRISERDEGQPTRGVETFSGDGKISKVRKLESRQELEEPSSFEGPKPLREILKRKRQEKTVPDDGDSREEGEYQKDGNENSSMVALDKQNNNSSNFKEGNTNSSGALNDEEEEGLITEEVEDQPSPQRENDIEIDDTMMFDNAENAEYETFDQKDVESDFDQVEGEEDDYPGLELEDEDEEECDDDGDDFAKRINVMFS